MFLFLMMIETAEDQEKFIMIYTRYKGLMFHVAKEFLNKREDSEDAVHQAFVKIAENISSIDISSAPKLKAFVVLITEHTAIDMQRRQSHREYVPLEECDGIGIEYDGPNLLASCILKLPARYRTVLLLRHHYCYSAKETAKMLGLTEANVRKLDHRAKKQLEVLCRKEELL